MSGQRKRRQSTTQHHRSQRPRGGPALYGRSHCVRTVAGFHALIELPAIHAVAIESGQPAQITSTDLPGLVLTGHVLKITVTQARVTTRPTRGSHSPGQRYLVTVAITETHPGLRHGLPVEVSIITRTLTDVLTVPNTAVIRTQNHCYVEVLEPTGERHLVSFTPGLIGHDTTEVLEGLTEGQEIILTPPSDTSTTP